MKARNYLLVSCKEGGKKRTFKFKMNESGFIKTVLKEVSEDEKCEVQLIECSQKEYKKLFE